MRTKVILACIMAAVSLALLACSSTPPASAECLFKWDQETEIAVGGTLTVTLESNPTTGFTWELTELSDQTVLALIEIKYEPGEEAKQEPSLSGAGGTEIWSFEALKKGEATISMEYSQPWEGGMKTAKIFEITVIVK